MNSLNGYKVKLTTTLRLGSMPRVAIVGGKTTPPTINFDQLVAGLNEPSVPGAGLSGQPERFPLEPK